jgi:hypothetical protein
MGPPRTRKVILALLLAVFALAVLSGVRLSLEPRLYWRDLWLLLTIIGFSATFWWLASRAPRSARLFALGSVLGATLELTADHYYAAHNMPRFTPGSWTPKRFYPLSMPVHRLFIKRGWASIAEAPVTPIFVGMAMSGALCGGILFTLTSGWRRKAAIARCEPQSNDRADA